MPTVPDFYPGLLLRVFHDDSAVYRPGGVWAGSVFDCVVLPLLFPQFVVFLRFLVFWSDGPAAVDTGDDRGVCYCKQTPI